MQRGLFRIAEWLFSPPGRRGILAEPQLRARQESACALKLLQNLPLGNCLWQSARAVWWMLSSFFSTFARVAQG